MTINDGQKTFTFALMRCGRQASGTPHISERVKEYKLHKKEGARIWVEVKTAKFCVYEYEIYPPLFINFLLTRTVRFNTPVPESDIRARGVITESASPRAYFHSHFLAPA